MTSTHSEAHQTLRLKDKVVMFDLDGTLIDDSYQVTDDGIYEGIEFAKNAGWTVGLSSDTPYDVLELWRARFGMNGPVIAEKGAHIVVDTLRPMDQSQSSDSSELQFIFSALRDSLIAYFESQGILVWHGNPVAVISGAQHLPFNGEAGQSLVLVNTHRKFSFGYSIRVFDSNGNLRIDHDLTCRLSEGVQHLLPAGYSFHEDLNYNHGLSIISSATMNKRVGSLALNGTLGIEKFAMVGNSVADFVGRDAAIHLAVGDASTDFKKLSDFVSSKSLTSGALESLNKLVIANKGVPDIGGAKD